MSLDKKSITELRNIAQGLGVADIFSKSRAHLLQDITIKSAAMASHDTSTQARTEYIVVQDKHGVADDASDVLMQALKPLIDRGLRVRISDGMWHYSCAGRTDSGTLTMPIRVALKKAHEILS